MIQMLYSHVIAGEAIRSVRLWEEGMARRLSARETEVLALAASGLSHKEIATRLGISSRTARNHLAHIYDKLGIHDRAQATLHAARLGLVQV